MRAKVLSRFRDKNNPEKVYEVGDSFEGTKERIEELAKGGWVKPTAAPRAKKSDKE